jgi:DNA helicase-2/ATP-dependent DNA helicase PcrA
MTVKMKIIEEGDNQEDKPSIQILKLSASSMKTFDQCPKKYYYNYIAKEPRKQWDHFDLGNLCHKALEIFHEKYKIEGTSKRTLAKLMSYSFTEARKEFPNISNTLLAEAKDLIKDYLKTISGGNMPLVKGVETSFNFNISDNVLVRGFLDRVDVLKDGKFHIVDYKTTKNAKYLDPFQLLIYGLWLKHEYPHIKDFKASYILLRHKSKLKSYDARKSLGACSRSIM